MSRMTRIRRRKWFSATFVSLWFNSFCWWKNSNKNYPHGWRGDPTDKNLVFEIWFAWQLYPWDCLGIRGYLIRVIRGSRHLAVHPCFIRGFFSCWGTSCSRGLWFNSSTLPKVIYGIPRPAFENREPRRHRPLGVFAGRSLGAGSQNLARSGISRSGRPVGLVLSEVPEARRPAPAGAAGRHAGARVVFVAVIPGRSGCRSTAVARSASLVLCFVRRDRQHGN